MRLAQAPSPRRQAQEVCVACLASHLHSWKTKVHDTQGGAKGPKGPAKGEGNLEKIQRFRRFFPVSDNANPAMVDTSSWTTHFDLVNADVVRILDTHLNQQCLIPLDSLAETPLQITKQNVQKV